MPSAIERYTEEVSRVSSVLHGHLAEQKQEYGGGVSSDGRWLVDNKFTYADIALIGLALERDEYDVGDFPQYKSMAQQNDFARGNQDRA